MIEEMQTGIVCTVLSEMEIRMEQLAIFGGEPVRKTPISYGHQYIDDADIEAVANVLRSDALTCGPVSYTHLTLPTIHSVEISVGAASLKKKN